MGAVLARKPGRFLAPAAIVLLVLSWTSNFAAIKIGLDHAPPLLFGGLRALVGGAVMVLVAWTWGGRPRFFEKWRAYAGLTLTNVALFVGLQTVAIDLLSSGLAAVLIYLQPVLVGLLAWPVLGEQLTAPKLGGLGLGFAGIVTVSAGGLTTDVSAAGIAVAVAAAVAWAAGTVYFKRVEDQVSVLWAVAAPFLLGGVLLSLLGLLVESPADISWTATFTAALSYAALVGTALAWFLWFGLVRAGEASRASSYIFLVPFVAVVIGTVLLDEPLNASLALGGALVVTGIVLVNRPRPRSRV